MFDVYKVATLAKSVKEIKFAFVAHHLLFKISPIFRNLGPFGIPWILLVSEKSNPVS